MKYWKKPEAISQEFVANEYVSACSYQIMCDVDIPDGAAVLYVPNGSNVDFDGSGDYHDDWGICGSPCGTVHNVDRDTEFFYHTFKYGLSHDDHTVTFSTPVEVAWWRELDASGNVVDLHWTSPANVANPESNKS